MARRKQVTSIGVGHDTEKRGFATTSQWFRSIGRWVVGALVLLNDPPAARVSLQRHNDRCVVEKADATCLVGRGREIPDSATAQGVCPSLGVRRPASLGRLEHILENRHELLGWSRAIQDPPLAAKEDDKARRAVHDALCIG